MATTLKKFFAFKIGMGQLFDAVSKKVVPFTALRLESCVVVRIQSNVSGGGFVLGLTPVAKEDLEKISDADFVKALKPALFINVSELGDHKIGSILDIKDMGLVEGDYLNIRGRSRGLGFQGVMKRHGFAGGPGGHGSNFHRQPGSSGSIRSSGKLIKGRRMPGRMGNDQVFVKDLQVVKLDLERNCILLKGPVPGKKNNLITLFKN